MLKIFLFSKLTLIGTAVLLEGCRVITEGAELLSTGSVKDSLITGLRPTSLKLIAGGRWSNFAVTKLKNSSPGFVSLLCLQEKKKRSVKQRKSRIK